jgi:DNA-binding SARP family transcriptional activator
VARVPEAGQDNRERPESDSTSGSSAAEDVFASFPYGILVFGTDRRLSAWNPAARRLLGPIETGSPCCRLLGCQSGAIHDSCLTELAQGHHTGRLPEVRLDLPDPLGTEEAVWATADQLGADGRVVVEIRPADRGDRRRRSELHWSGAPRLRIRTFGRTTVEGREAPIIGDWLDQRPGQVLRLLISERGRLVHSDEIAEAIWPGAGPEGAGKVRYTIHTLRQALEPRRAKRAPSPFVIASRGGYRLNPETVSVDADDFERLVRIGSAARTRGAIASAKSALQAATDMYEGDFLADEPYAEWVLAERQRLHKLASDALEGLTEIAVNERDLKAAADSLARLCQLLPYDVEVHRRLIAQLLAHGRMSDAAACYRLLQTRMESVFGEKLEFALSDVSASEAHVL